MWILFAFGSALFAGLTAIWYLWSGRKAESEIFQQKS